jgi:Neuraminidase (sialidase)
MKLSTLCLLLFAAPLYGVRAQVNSTIKSAKKDIVLRLPAGPNNPRNSEGDFITLKGGKLLFIYSHFTGTSDADDANAYLASRFSTDKGRTWSKVDQIVARKEEGMNIMSVSLLRLKDGDIALFYGRKISQDNDIPVMRISKDEGKTWDNPTPCITDKKGYFVLNNDRVIQLKNGRLLMPVSLHVEPGEKWSNRGKIFCYYSDDNGKNWKSSTEVPNPDKIITQEPGVVELKNGEIFMFIRTNAGVQYASYSKNRGETWSAISPTNIVSPLSPASIKRIPSTGDLLLVWDNNGKNQKRTPLDIAISKDEGKHWVHIHTLETDPNGSFCYTAIHFIGRYVLFAYLNFEARGLSIARLKVKDL